MSPLDVSLHIGLRDMNRESGRLVPSPPAPTRRADAAPALPYIARMPHLLLTRRFLPLFLSQSLGALNDNLFKNALVALVVFRTGEGGTALVALAGALFILPYVLLSATAGQLADKLDKARLLQTTKLIEVAIMVAAAAGLLLQSVPALLLVLFALGVQAAFFSPLKFGLLPEHLRLHEQVRGNALIEAGTFGAIIAGTILGGALVLLPHGTLIVAVVGLVLAVAGAAAAFNVPASHAVAPELLIGRNLLRETVALIRLARANRPAWRCILGLSWFWTVGAVYLTEFPSMTQKALGGDVWVLNLLLTGFAVGIAMGSILAGRLLRNGPSAWPVAPAALMLSVMTLMFAALIATPWAKTWTSPAALLSTGSGVLAYVCLLGAAASGGVFTVPLYTILIHRSDPARRGSMIAANNVVNAAFVVAGSGLVAAMAAIGLQPWHTLGLAGVLNLGAAWLLWRRRPEP